MELLLDLRRNAMRWSFASFIRAKAAKQAKVAKIPGAKVDWAWFDGDSY